jgi:hypothetical protein
MRLVQSHVAWLGQRRNLKNVLDRKYRLHDNLEGKRTLWSLCIDGRTILEWILKKSFGRAWTGLIWLRMVQLAGSCKCGLHKMRGISWLAEELSSLEGLCCMESASQPPNQSVSQSVSQLVIKLAVSIREVRRGADWIKLAKVHWLFLIR